MDKVKKAIAVASVVIAAAKVVVEGVEKLKEAKGELATAPIPEFEPRA